MTDPANAGAPAPEASSESGASLDDVPGTSTPVNPSNPKGLHFKKRPVGATLLCIFFILVASFFCLAIIAVAKRVIGEFGLYPGVIISTIMVILAYMTYKIRFGLQ